MELEPPKSYRERRRSRTCPVCNETAMVRLDSRATHCRKCSVIKRIPDGPVIRRPGDVVGICPQCETPIRYQNHKYCSVACQRAAQRARRLMDFVPRKAGISELELSRGAEFLVCAELTLAGYPAYPSAAGLPYDVVVDLGDSLIRLQVKATRGPKPTPQRLNYTPAYLFNIRKCGRYGRQAYKQGDFEGFALVALDIRQIAYIPMSESAVQTIQLRVPGYVPKPSAKHRAISEYPWDEMLAEITGDASSPEPEDFEVV